MAGVSCDLVQNEPPRRGRPRQFDADEVLLKARDTFWQAGYQATSLDRLSDAMGLKRPSLYGAFGDKQALYVTLLRAYRETNLATVRRLLGDAATLREGLAAVYAGAIAIYVPNGQGCFILNTAPSEAETDAVVRQELGQVTDDLDAAFASRFAWARTEGEIGRDVEPQDRGRLATAVLHSLSIRARGGEPRATLEQLARTGVDLLLS
jgi:TetR/AcrR family transcriptional regulator, copper-responsive repressor